MNFDFVSDAFLNRMQAYVPIVISAVVICQVIALIILFRDRNGLVKQLGINTRAIQNGLTNLVAIEFVTRPIYQYYLNRGKVAAIPEYDHIIDNMTPEVIDRANEIYNTELTNGEVSDSEIIPVNG